MVDAVPLEDVTGSLFEDAMPWRSFRWYKGQRHFSGTYWSATMQGPVGYESRLELANLLLADFDPRVTWILSQPFLLEGDDRGRYRRHVPDFLLRYADSTISVVDVKPRERLSAPKVRASLDWSGRVIRAHGWEYCVQSEPDPVLLENVRFLAGYRRSFQFQPELTRATAAVLQAPMTFGAAARAVTPVAGDPATARAVLLHLLWRQDLRTDLSVPLGNLSVLESK
jgi:hypothetical protein